VAWAFLKLVSMHGQPNLGAFRLQLHRFSSRRPAVKRPHVPPVYFEWVYQKNSAWLDYPSTLSVYVRGAPPPAERQVVAARPMFATDREVGRIDFAELSKVLQVQDSAVSDEIASRDAAALSEDARRALLRARAPNARCHVPDTLLHEVSTAPNGVFAVAFSPNGRLLAAACADRLLFTVKVFETDSGTLLCTFNGHHDLVYDLGWNRDGSEIVSASSDHTAQVWSLVTLSSESVLSFQHTSFVYAAQFHPVSRFPPLIVTASYDAKVRVWSRVSGALLRVLSDHAAHVNSLVFDNLGHRFFTGDAVGVFKIFDDRGEPAELVAAGRAVEEASSRGVRGSDDDEDDEDAAEEEDEDESPLRERERSKELQRRLKRIAVRGEKEQNWDARFQCVKSIAHPEVRVGELVRASWPLTARARRSRATSSTAFGSTAAPSNCSCTAVTTRSTSSQSLQRRPRLCASSRAPSAATRSCAASSVPTGRPTKSALIARFSHAAHSLARSRYVLAGSEDGRAYFWQASNGQLVRVLETGFTQPLFSVAWHPTQHLVALGSFGADFPLLLFERQAGAGGPQSPPDSPRARDP
jgi:WD40 repeat protein